MPSKSKFSGMFDGPDQAVQPDIQQAAGRHRGKKSDPEFKQFTYLGRKTTHKRARRLIEDLYGEQKDFSDVVEQLLVDFISRHDLQT
jgi:hypothetical protein